MSITKTFTFAAMTAGALLIGGTASAQAAKPAAKPKITADAKLRAEAKVSEEAAVATALKAVPGGHLQAGELEKENGKLIYSLEIKVPGKSGIEEVNVDAVTGKVVGKEHETPKMEKKEAANEAKEKKPPKQ